MILAGTSLMTEPGPQAEATQSWRGRSGESWTARYWQAIGQAHRRDMLAALHAIRRPFGSLVELGCNAGPNLRLIHEAFPGVALAGADVNAEALGYGLRQARDEGWGYETMTLDLTRDLSLVIADQRAFDVVLCCYALAYVAPANIERVLREVKCLARRAVLLLEPTATSRPSEPCAEHEWAHPFPDLVRAVWPDAWSITDWPVSPPADRLNHLTLVEVG